MYLDTTVDIPCLTARQMRVQTHIFLGNLAKVQRFIPRRTNTEVVETTTLKLYVSNSKEGIPLVVLTLIDLLTSIRTGVDNSE